MAALQLFFAGKLGKRLVEFRVQEKRVVAEAPGAPRRLEDDAIGATLDDGQNLVFLRQGNDANVVRGTAGGGGF